ncbi:hypothetical protein GCM10025880_48490 [Methylorubrum aminovorans]|uniref:helix-turn-helix domain-containing protein n=1 Tax=Methylorubrum aminovorans TaxID=269069 RepID=UPI0023E9010A|nr:hypothetical protein GCM10025880_48490 [Methylorubrum aminovorans]
MNLPSESLAAALGQELRSARRRRRVTQKTLAASARLDLATVQNLEAGRGTLASMRAVLGVLHHRFTAQSNEQDIGEWLAAHRKSAGLSQQRLAFMAGCSKPSIIQVERGQGHINSLLAVLSALKLASTLRLDEQPKEAASGASHPAPAIRVIQGDCREIMRELAAEGVQFDACVTDPPITSRSQSVSAGRTLRHSKVVSPAPRILTEGWRVASWARTGTVVASRSMPIRGAPSTTC